MKQKKRVFPKDFFWGASTSAHQVEGGLKNQWSVWELANAAELARTAKDSRLMQGVPHWQHIRSRAENPENYVSDRGIEHFKRYKEDFQLLKELNLNAFRFGIEWSRLEPEQGKWDDAAFEHYRRYIRELRNLDIEPFPTLWHWTMPTWFTSEYFKGFKRQTPKQPVSDLGWHLKPGDLHPLLLEVWRRFHQPVIITENGLADERDKYRKWWLEESIAAMKRALKDGVDVKGYLHWSLLDNFEWKFGWWPKFGLVAVDHDHNLKRTIRPSAKWFADVIKRESRSSS